MLVLDTKYKVTEEASNADIHQMVTYAHLMNCTDAVLIYPDLPKWHETYDMNAIRVHTLDFPIDSDLEAGGQGLLRRLVGLQQ